MGQFLSMTTNNIKWVLRDIKMNCFQCLPLHTLLCRGIILTCPSSNGQFSQTNGSLFSLLCSHHSIGLNSYNSSMNLLKANNYARLSKSLRLKLEKISLQSRLNQHRNHLNVVKQIMMYRL